MAAKKQPIDPIDAMCRISLLNFKSINTKIGIGGHAVNIQDPGPLQCVFRTYYGDGKEDLFELFYLVTHLTAWFLVPLSKKPPNSDKNVTDEVSDNKNDKKIDPRFLEDLKKMVGYMCLGLEKLQNTYKFGNVVLAIQFYINLLDDGLNGSFDVKKLPKCLIEDLWIDSPLKTKVTELWDYERLHRVCAVFDDCFAEANKNSKFKDELINGYLLSIEKTLCAYEREFNTNIKQWG